MRPVLLTSLVACSAGDLVSAQPGPGQPGVSVTRDLVLTFSRDVGEADVLLRAVGTPEPVPIEVQIDGREIIVDPYEPLAYATLHVLHIDDVEHTFRTHMNPRQRHESFDDGGALTTVIELGRDEQGRIVREERNNAAGDLLSYATVVYDGLRPVRTQGAGHPGADGVWYTDDDAEVSRTDTAYTDAGFVDLVQYVSPGVDDRLDTPDDQVVLVTDHEHLDDLPWREITLSPGADGAWLTDDDVPARYVQTDRDHLGRALRSATSAEAGPDGLWFTPDDFASGSLVTHDDAGRLTGTTRLLAGPDGLTFTADDVAVGSVEQEIGPEGWTVRQIHRDAAGEVTGWVALDRQLDGLVAREISYVDAGPDGTWLTADDVPVHYVRTRYTDDGRRIDAVMVWAPGPDGQWLTADDPIMSRTTWEADFDG